ncbi:MAG: hypothetical protein B6D46_03580 [Polyangiaceae bacterium UTPRO1]|jgi:thiamine pyrophosphate-dependent acetolactate synthase large subunit-like protein|nr:thiamine pyrophosphate-binding protein [Myxococcales bacterium]OQY68489.1 MAG: hypothetical protein B6D46_03580 [Polyangiaceae bacterium UTPRO1]
MPVHGGKLAARALKKAGVECVFTLSGGYIMPLYDGCVDEGIRIIDVRHEQAAVHAADACYDTKRIPEYIEPGIRHAVSGIPGPAFLEIPKNVFMGSAEQIDLIILAGAQLDFRLVFGKTIPASAKVIQLDMDATLIGINHGVDVGLVENLACSFELLLEEMKNAGLRLDFSDRLGELRTIETAADEEGRGRAQQ